MRPKPTLLSVCCLLAALIFSLPAGANQDPGEGVAITRFALLTGANYGGLDRVTLRFAESDARAISKVLEELGGVNPENRLLLTDPSPADLRDAFSKMRRQIATSKTGGGRTEFVFYYSGHSDESGLLLSGRIFSYKEIRKIIRELPANVRVAILDSCASGAFTRTKGGVRRKPFLVDTSTRVRGYAVLTSSSANEAAQESDRVGGSFFTHFLVSGLRGAADTDRDGRVTLAEAYQYAFNETLARTETTQVGPQHPHYDFQLAGSGDLTLTDLRGTSAVLELGPEVQGRLFIRDEDGRLIAEVNKPTGAPMNIGLEPGVYQVTLELPAQLKRGTVEISEGKSSRLNVAQLKTVEAEITRARGAAGSATVVEAQSVPFSFSVFPGLETNPKPPVVNQFSLNLFVGWAHALRGVEVSAFGGIREGPVTGVQAAGLFSFAGDMRGLQASGVFNMSTGPFRGVMAAGVANFTDYDLRGLQAAGCVNFARSIAGVQASVLNVTTDDLRGVQAGVANYAGDVTGVQAGVVSVATGEVRGLQVGVVNVAGEMGDDGVPIGLVNIVGDGILAPTVWTSDTSLVNLGLKMGSRRFYSILGMAFHPDQELDEEVFRPIAGLGGRFRLDGPLWLDLDVLSTGPQLRYNREVKLDILSKLRLVLGWQIAKHFAVYGGVSLNYLVSKERAHAGPAWLRLWARSLDDHCHDLGIGLLLGIQI